MRRILLVMAAAALMVMMMVAMAAPSFARQGIGGHLDDPLYSGGGDAASSMVPAAVAPMRHTVYVLV
jgi:hypothetical protein